LEYPPTNKIVGTRIGEVWSFDLIIYGVKQFGWIAFSINHNFRCYSIIGVSWQDSSALKICLPGLTSQAGRTEGVRVESRWDNAGNMHWGSCVHEWRHAVRIIVKVIGISTKISVRMIDEWRDLKTSSRTKTSGMIHSNKISTEKR
jgi:hypothetical protein